MVTRISGIPQPGREDLANKRKYITGPELLSPVQGIRQDHDQKQPESSGCAHQPAATSRLVSRQ